MCLNLWLLGCCCALGLATCAAPGWWRAGRPRDVHRSYAEVGVSKGLGVGFSAFSEY